MKKTLAGELLLKLSGLPASGNYKAGQFTQSLEKTVGLNRGFFDSLPEEGWLLCFTPSKENEAFCGYSAVGGRATSGSKDAYAVFRAVYATGLDEDGIASSYATEVPVGSFYKKGYEKVPSFATREDGSKDLDCGLQYKDLLDYQVQKVDGDQAIYNTWMKVGQPDCLRAEMLKGKAVHYVTAGYSQVSYKKKAAWTSGSDFGTPVKVRVITEIKDLSEVFSED